MYIRIHVPTAAHTCLSPFAYLSAARPATINFRRSHFFNFPPPPAQLCRGALDDPARAPCFPRLLRNLPCHGRGSEISHCSSRMYHIREFGERKTSPAQMDDHEGIFIFSANTANRDEASDVIGHMPVLARCYCTQTIGFSNIEKKFPAGVNNN